MTWRFYSLHCFTRSTKSETPDPALLYSDDRETRIFDFRRYALSRRLPGIIGGLMNCKCFHAGRGNFVTVEITDDSGRKIEYEIYFTAAKSSRRGVVRVYVQSAYVRDVAHHANRPPRKPVSFQIILFNTVNGIAMKVSK